MNKHDLKKKKKKKKKHQNLNPITMSHLKLVFGTPLSPLKLSLTQTE